MLNEYIIKQKCEGKVLFKRLLLIFSYIFAATAATLAVLLFSPPILYIPFFLLVAAFIAIAVFLTWRFVSVEYELSLSSGELSLTAIYGKKTRRRLTSIPTGAIYEIGEYDDEAYERLDSISLQKNYILVSSLSAPVIFYALFDEGKDKCVLYFEADENMVSELRRQNSSAFRKGKVSRDRQFSQGSRQ